jgi:tetratricopeptide (TPR) repeat protein
MFFWVGNSFVALLFFGLALVGIRQRAWMFAVMNLIGMALDALIVALDVFGRLNVIMLFWAMPSLAFVLATAITLVFREQRTVQAQPLAASNANSDVAKASMPPEYLIVVDEKRLAVELRRDAGLAASDRKKALDWWKKGNAAFSQHNFAEAEACFEQAAKSARAPSALSNWAGILIAIDRAEAALQHCEAACRRDGEHHEAWINRGCALLLLARPEDALACFDQATALQPNLLAPWIYRGRALRKLHRFQQAVESYDTALRINPNRPECWHEKALALADLNEFDEALKCFDRALSLDPEHLRAALDRGLALERLGRVDQAVSSYRHFLQQAPPAMNGRADAIRTRLRRLEKNPDSKRWEGDRRDWD